MHDIRRSLFHPFHQIRFVVVAMPKIDESAKAKRAREDAARRRGGANVNHSKKKLDSYLPKRPYSEERCKPWEM